MNTTREASQSAVREVATRYTIHDIARELGVSARTVSRVLNEQRGVSPATRGRIEEFIQKAGYQPHSGARSLRSRHIDTIGVTVASPPEVVPLSQDLLGRLFAELYRLFGARGLFIDFDLHTKTVNGVRDYCRGVWQERFGACVIAGAFRDDDLLLHRLHESGRPYVALARLYSAPECNSATVDYEEAAYVSTKFLLDRGHTRLGMLQALRGYQPGTERMRGYRRALDEFGIPFDDQLVRPVGFSAREMIQATHQLLSNRSITGLLDFSGTQDAISLRQGSARSGRKLGADVELVVWTYTFNAMLLAEAAAHVWLPVMEASTAGLERLAAQLFEDGNESFQVLYRPQLYQPPSVGEMPRPRPVFDVMQ